MEQNKTNQEILEIKNNIEKKNKEFDTGLLNNY